MLILKNVAFFCEVPAWKAGAEGHADVLGGEPVHGVHLLPVPYPAVALRGHAVLSTGRVAKLYDGLGNTLWFPRMHLRVSGCTFLQISSMKCVHMGLIFSPKFLIKKSSII